MDPIIARPARKGDKLRAAAEAGREHLIDEWLREFVDVWEAVCEGDPAPTSPPERLAPPWLDNRRPHRFGGRS